MVKQYKIDEVANVAPGKKNIILTNYSGMGQRPVELLKDPRAAVQDRKQRLFKRAMSESAQSASTSTSRAHRRRFHQDDVGEIAKVLGTSQRAGNSHSPSVCSTMSSGADQVKQIADLPSKEVLLSQVMSLVNGPGTKIAIGINQIMASLARGINAVAEKNAQ